MTLSVKELEEKIASVNEDLKKINDIKAIDTLNFYKEYLEEQLAEAKRNERKL